MKRIVLFLSVSIIFSLSTTAFADDWQELVTEAYSKADLVMLGTVKSIDNQTARDGGHVYDLEVVKGHKGAPGNRVTIRAGGFFYLVPLEMDESVLVFLRSTSGGAGPAYSLVEAESLTPMVFRVSGAQARPVDGRLQASFASVSAEEIEALLSSIKQ